MGTIAYSNVVIDRRSKYLYKYGTFLIKRVKRIWGQ